MICGAGSPGYYGLRAILLDPVINTHSYCELNNVKRVDKFSLIASC